MQKRDSKETCLDERKKKTKNQAILQKLTLMKDSVQI